MTEPLYVPEQYLGKVIEIIENGLKTTKGVPRECRRGLVKWCKDEREYMKDWTDT